MSSLQLNFIDLKSKLLKNIIIKQVASDIEINDLLKIIKKMNTSNNFIQLFDANAIINKKHLILAYLNALNTFKESQNTSQSLAIEMLLFTSMSRQINTAISLVGIKSKFNFILFSNNLKKYEKFKHYIKKEKDFLPSLFYMKKCIKQYNLNINEQRKLSNQELQQQINIELFQRITISKFKK